MIFCFSGLHSKGIDCQASLSTSNVGPKINGNQLIYQGRWSQNLVYLDFMATFLLIKNIFHNTFDHPIQTTTSHYYQPDECNIIWPLLKLLVKLICSSWRSYYPPYRHSNFNATSKTRFNLTLSFTGRCNVCPLKPVSRRHCSPPRLTRKCPSILTLSLSVYPYVRRNTFRSVCSDAIGAKISPWKNYLFASLQERRQWKKYHLTFKTCLEERKLNRYVILWPI